MIKNNCEIIDDCYEKIVKPKGFIGYKITRQLLFISLANIVS